ncbi:MazG-like nucleotide pyrophosphohydrolase [Microbacterium phage Quenya]|uniref:MazG-like nucleotide pyrophosphohydrolase n=1 Tax=Microbacterium phage Quenya TaxID=2776868 RepID=UPI0018A3C03C|nr:MazG-like nucleotide pyrophosphohydrolase [Microbacterium phage Quenya]QOP64265.1 MazG-like nucleotide pyrophosphohydrolase [Microbacterium phage Quenya]
MTNSNFEDVQAFHGKYGLTEDPGVGNDEWLDFREDFMDEELAEFKKARREGDRAGMFDALLDLVYVAMGTADGLRFPWQAGWDRVQAANMSKVRAARDGADSKRGTGFDVVKPPGWRAPDHSDLVAAPARCPRCHDDGRGCRPMQGRLGTDEVRDGLYCATHGRFYPGTHLEGSFS